MSSENPRPVEPAATRTSAGTRSTGSRSTGSGSAGSGSTNAGPARTGRGGTSTRREQILAAAAGKFARHGFHGVGIDDIGAAVGISGPALYRHFRNKEAMLAEMLTGISDKLLDGGRERARAASDPDGALNDLVRWHVDFALSNPELITVQLRDLDTLTGTDRHAVRELQRSYVEIWVDVLRRKHPDLDAATARATAHAALGLINSTPFSTHLDFTAMSQLLHEMAMGAVNAIAEPGAIAGPHVRA